MTLMSERVGQGPTRRCDARCYNAKQHHCTCLCGGLNHGAGLKQASENTANVFAPILEAATNGRQLGKEIRRQIAERRQQMVFPNMSTGSA